MKSFGKFLCYSSEIYKKNHKSEERKAVNLLLQSILQSFFSPQWITNLSLFFLSFSLSTNAWIFSTSGAQIQEELVVVLWGDFLGDFYTFKKNNNIETKLWRVLDGSERLFWWSCTRSVVKYSEEINTNTETRVNEVVGK